MDVGGSAEDRAFRDEVRRFLEEAFTPELRAMAARQAGVFAEPEVGLQWHRALYERGWITPSWPVEHGGAGWTASQHLIFHSECARIGAPQIAPMGINLCGPVIIRFGTEAQKAFFLPAMRSGDHYWCQGYSEPDSGSDLASLQTRALRDGDNYVVNGSKIWTTHAHHANWIFLLVRTSDAGRPQEGITFLVSPLDAPGIVVRPILSMSGEHEVNQVFFDDVRIPVSYRIGEENQGWTLAKYLLEFERGGAAHGARLEALIGSIRAVAAVEVGDDGCPLGADPGFEREIAELEIQSTAVDWTEKRITFGDPTEQRSVAAAASLKKLAGTETTQKLAELKLEALGSYAAADQRDGLGAHPKQAPIGGDHAVTPTARHLNGRASTIFGGSSEVQRNILARMSLGL